MRKGHPKVISHPPYTLVDKLIIGGFIEARSCERFATIAPFLPPQMNEFYVSLSLRSKALSGLFDAGTEH